MSNNKPRKSQRIIRQGEADQSNTLIESNSKVLHAVNSTLSQDFTKSSSNQDVGIGPRGSTSGNFASGINANKLKNDYLYEDHEPKNQKKSSILTSKNVTRVQGAVGTPSKSKIGNTSEGFGTEISSTKKNPAKMENFDRIEAHFTSDRIQGMDYEIRKEGLVNMHGVPSKNLNQRGVITESFSQQHHKTTTNEQLNLDDSSKRSKVVKTKRRVAKTINTANGSNTSGPLFE